MNKLGIVVFAFFCSLNCRSQNTTGKLYIEPVRQTNVERYRLDYEVKGWNSIQDTASVNLLNLEYFDSLREENIDKEVFDNLTTLTIIVYSQTRTAGNKKE